MRRPGKFPGRLLLRYIYTIAFFAAPDSQTPRWGDGGGEVWRKRKKHLSTQIFSADFLSCRFFIHKSDVEESVLLERLLKTYFQEVLGTNLYKRENLCHRPVFLSHQRSLGWLMRRTASIFVQDQIQRQEQTKKASRAFPFFGIRIPGQVENKRNS